MKKFNFTSKKLLIVLVSVLVLIAILVPTIAMLRKTEPIATEGETESESLSITESEAENKTESEIERSSETESDSNVTSEDESSSSDNIDSENSEIFTEDGYLEDDEPVITGNHVEAELSSDVIVYNYADTVLVKKSIISSAVKDENLHLTMKNDSLMEDLKPGDLFLMQGLSDSIIGDAYFGRILSKEHHPDSIYYIIETPALMDVFDKFDVDYSQKMTYESISEIVAMPGAEISVTSGEEENEPSTLSVTSATALDSNPIQIETNPSPCIKFKVDLVEILAPEAKKPSSASENFPIFYTDTGACYHLEFCHCLAQSKHPISLEEAKKLYRPCKICDPPQGSLTNGEFSYKDEATLSGKISLDNLNFDFVCDSESKDLEDGFKNLAVVFTGEVNANAKLDANFEVNYNHSAKTLLDNEWLDFEGIQDKWFPIAFVAWNGKWDVSIGKNAMETKIGMPFTVGFLIYTDIHGNLTAATQIETKYTYPINYRWDLFTDGDYVEKDPTPKYVTEEQKSKFDVTVKAELAANDVDFQLLSGSIMLYVGNMNVVELMLARAGAEFDGTMAFDSTKIDENYGFDVDVSACLYLEFLEGRLRLKTKSKWDVADDLGFDVSFGPLRVNLKEWEWKTPTQEELGELEFELYEAEDEKDNYYLVAGIGSFRGENLVIPSTHNGLPVKVIKQNAFYRCGQIKKVTIANSITTIQRYAFSECGNLNSVIFEKNSQLIYINYGAFSWNNNLSNIILPYSLKHIEDSVFLECDSLNTIILPDSLLSIGESVFLGTGYWYNDLNWENGALYIGNYLIDIESQSRSYKIKDGTTIIAGGAIDRCDNLTEIIIPSSVRRIDSWAVASCENLTTVTFEANSMLIEIGENAFYNCKSLKSINLPQSLKIIEKFAFCKCVSLSTINIPINVLKIDYQGFSSCVNLSEFNFSGTIKQWESINRYRSWDFDTPDYIIKCSDGIINKES